MPANVTPQSYYSSYCLSLILLWLNWYLSICENVYHPALVLLFSKGHPLLIAAAMKTLPYTHRHRNYHVHTNVKPVPSTHRHVTMIWNSVTKNHCHYWWQTKESEEKQVAFCELSFKLSPLVMTLKRWDIQKTWATFGRRILGTGSWLEWHIWVMYSSPYQGYKQWSIMKRSIMKWNDLWLGDRFLNDILKFKVSLLQMSNVFLNNLNIC